MMNRKTVIDMMTEKMNQSQALMDKVEKELGYVPKEVQDSEFNSVMTLIKVFDNEDRELEEILFNRVEKKSV